ncbi:MAG: DNA translocase FtsK 4TM domain-containing protein [Planctomycetota bacterium]
MRILITAGPTREHLDDVRFLSNASSGRMGFALVEACLAAGDTPTLILGPVDLAPPEGIEVIHVTSAEEMKDAVLAALPHHDALIMAAAVADYRPARRAIGKPKRSEGTPKLELEPTPDILRTAKEAAPESFKLVGFALEAGNVSTGARAKLERKGVHLIVGDGPSAIGANITTVEIHGREGLLERLVRPPVRQPGRARMTLMAIDRRYRVREGLGLTLILLAVFAFLSFASYHPADSADIVYPANDPPANAGGWVGATLAHGLFHFFGGVASFSLVFLLAAWGLNACVIRGRTGNLWLRGTGAVLFLCALAATDALMGLAPLAGLPTGGALGTVVGPYFLAGNFGGTGAYLIVIWAALLSLLLATDFLFYRAAKELYGRSTGWAQAAKAAVAASDAAKRAAFAASDKVANAAGAAVDHMLAAVPELDEDAEIDADLALAESGVHPISQRTDRAPVSERVARDPSGATGRRSKRSKSGRGSGRIERDGSGRLIGPPQPTSITEKGPFLLPAPTLLDTPQTADPRRNTTLVKEKCRDLTRALSEFNVEASWSWAPA